MEIPVSREDVQVEAWVHAHESLDVDKRVHVAVVAAGHILPEPLQILCVGDLGDALRVVNGEGPRDFAVISLDDQLNGLPNRLQELTHRANNAGFSRIFLHSTSR